MGCLFVDQNKKKIKTLFLYNAILLNPLCPSCYFFTQCFFHFSLPLSFSVYLLRSCPLIPSPSQHLPLINTTKLIIVIYSQRIQIDFISDRINCRKRYMESSLGFMAVFAVSGSVVFLASQFHKRLLSDYLDKFELEIRTFKNSYSIFYFVNLIMNNLIMVRFIFYIFFLFQDRRTIW